MADLLVARPRQRPILEAWLRMVGMHMTLMIFVGFTFTVGPISNQGIAIFGREHADRT